MADPLSIGASLLAISTAAIQSTKSLYEAVKRFKDRDKTLRRLQNELGDLVKILESLSLADEVEEPLLALLRGPTERCTQVCHDFEVSMAAFNRKSRIGVRDWTKMEFMRGDMNEFIETVAGYKSTISVGLGTISMHTSKVSQQVLLEYNEMIQDTTYNLELHLQRIEQKMTRLAVEHNNPPKISIDLEDERDVTRQCLRICEEAKSHLQNISTEASSLLQDSPQNANLEQFEAQVRTRRTLDDTRESLAQTSKYLVRRLQTLLRDEGPENDQERLRLQSDIEISKQCLDVCNIASEISRQKVFRIGEIVADGDSDQVVVNTLADLFDVGKALSKDKSAQLVGSMTDESLQRVSEKRYDSRFGALVDRGRSTGEVSTKPDPTFRGAANSRPRQRKPSSNEMRKRTSES